MLPVIAGPHSLRRWRLALLAACVLGGLISATWGPRLPDLTGDLRIPVAGIGVMLAAATAGLLRRRPAAEAAPVGVRNSG